MLKRKGLSEELVFHMLFVFLLQQHNYRDTTLFYHFVNAKIFGGGIVAILLEQWERGM